MSTNAQLRWTPIGYRLEYRAGDYGFYSLEDFARETFAPSARICGLYSAPQPGCSASVAAYRGRFWHNAKNYQHNCDMDPHAVPLYLGQVLHEPAHDAMPGARQS